MTPLELHSKLCCHSKVVNYDRNMFVVLATFKR
jgi:hypothetical protein